MKLIIVHDRVGEIVAMGEVDLSSKKNEHLRIIPSQGQMVLELEKPTHLHTKSPIDFAKEYKVDVAGQKLIKR